MYVYMHVHKWNIISFIMENLFGSAYPKMLIYYVSISNISLLC